MGVWSLSLNFFALFLLVSSFSGGEDRFLKKYAMTKIYESCFGVDVVEQIRKELKAACEKCSSAQIPNEPVPSSTPLPPVPAGLPSSDSFDIEKFQQAILAYRPNLQPQSNFYRPYNPGFAPFYSPPFNNPGYQGSMFYPGFAGDSGQFSQYGAFPMIGQPLFGNRLGRNFDIKSQLEDITSKAGGRVRNITCVMQELGYLDENLEPNFQRISERIASLPVALELKKDMQDGLEFCQQFSECVPEVKKDKSPLLSYDLLKPMFFFKCYKQKKLEACIIKDVRSKYSGISEEEIISEESKRSGKSLSKDAEIEDLTAQLYHLLYGNDIDTLF